MRYYLGILLTAIILLLPSCRKDMTVGREAAFVSFETEILSTELDGSYTLRAWGSGRDKADAIEQAKKNAVRDIIFKGVNKGPAGAKVKPLIFEVNAQEKYEFYFNQFFADGGAYEAYVTSEDENRTSRVQSKSNTQYNYGVVVCVLRADLRQRLIDDDIIKP